MTLIVLADYGNNDGECFPSMAAVAARAGLGLRSVARSVAALEKAGYLTITRQEGRPNKYLINLSHSGISTEPTYATVAYHPGHSGIPPMPDRHTPYATVAYEDTNKIPTKKTKEEDAEPAAAALPETDPEAGAVFGAYQDNIGSLTPIISESIGEAIDELTAAWVLAAIKIAAERNVRNWKYIDGILKSWQAQGHMDYPQAPAQANGNGEAAWQLVMSQIKAGAWTLPKDGPELAAIKRVGGWPRFKESQDRDIPFLKREFLQEYHHGH